MGQLAVDVSGGERVPGIGPVPAPWLVSCSVQPEGDMTLVGCADRKPAPGTQLNQYTPIGPAPVLSRVMLYWYSPGLIRESV